MDTFLKHADEVQEDDGMLAVPRTLYDSIRAVEPALQRGDLADYLRRLGNLQWQVMVSPRPRHQKEKPQASAFEI